MGETMIAPPLPEEPPADSFLSRALGVFISPGQAFESIARRPDFLAPLIISMVGSIVLIEAMLEKIGAARIIRQSLEMSGKAAQMTPEQIDQTVQKVATFTAISMRVGGVLGVADFSTHHRCGGPFYCQRHLWSVGEFQDVLFGGLLRQSGSPRGGGSGFGHDLVGRRRAIQSGEPRPHHRGILPEPAGDLEAALRDRQFVRHFPGVVHHPVFPGAFRRHGEKSWGRCDFPHLPRDMDTHRAGARRHGRDDGIARRREAGWRKGNVRATSHPLAACEERIGQIHKSHAHQV